MFLRKMSPLSIFLNVGISPLGDAVTFKKTIEIHKDDMKHNISTIR